MMEGEGGAPFRKRSIACNLNTIVIFQ